MKRQQVSGAQKRKQAVEKKQKIEAVAQQLPKLTSFFQQNTEPTLLQKEADNIEQSPADDAIVDSTPNEPTPENSGGNLTPTASKQLHPHCSNPAVINDPGTWQDLDNDDVAYWTDKGPSDCQHRDGPFDESRRRFPVRLLIWRT